MIPLLIASVLIADIKSELKDVIQAELFYAKAELSGADDEWQFSNNLKVVKICSVTDSETTPHRYQVRCKVTDTNTVRIKLGNAGVTTRDMTAIIYVDVWIEKLDPEDADSWRIDSYRLLKVSKKQK